MTVAEYIFDYLQKKGLETVYMVSGSSAMWLTDALYKNKELDAICCHHEQAAAMSADGYGRTHRTPGCCLVTIGPGATNAITGVAQAYLDSSPMFVISGQANSRLLQYEKETGIRQHGTQSLNLEPIVSSITKYFCEVMNEDDIQRVMEEAYTEATSGRKGPVWIDVPIDIQNKQIAEKKLDGKHTNDADDIDVDVSDIISLLSEAKKPLIWAGGGVRSAGAADLLRQVAHKHRIPVVVSRAGIDVMPSDDTLFVGRPGAYGDRASHFAIQQCDLLLVLGCRLSVSSIGYYPNHLAPLAKIVKVDIDQKELDKTDVPVDIDIWADLRKFLSQLLKEGKAEEATNREWIRYCNKLKMEYSIEFDKIDLSDGLDEYWVTKYISDRVSDESNIVVDTGSVCNIVSQSWNLKSNQRYLISGGLSCMGFWATAMGAYQKNRNLIAITGDGSAQMNIQELATLKYNDIPLKLFVYNNNGYMLIRHNQHNYMEDRFLGVGPDSGLKTPNFTKVAEAYGIKAYRISEREELESRLLEVLETNQPVLCEIMVKEFAPIEPRIASKVMPDGSLKAAEFDDLAPFLDEDDKPKPFEEF